MSSGYQMYNTSDIRISDILISGMHSYALWQGSDPKAC